MRQVLPRVTTSWRHDLAASLARTVSSCPCGRELGKFTGILAFCFAFCVQAPSRAAGTRPRPLLGTLTVLQPPSRAGGRIARPKAVGTVSASGPPRLPDPVPPPSLAPGSATAWALRTHGPAVGYSRRRSPQSAHVYTALRCSPGDYDPRLAYLHLHTSSCQ